MKPKSSKIIKTNQRRHKMNNMPKQIVAKEDEIMQDSEYSGVLILIGLVALAALVWFCKWGGKI